MLEIQVTHSKGRVPVTVMHLKGVFDSAGSDIFDASAQEIFTCGARNVLLDFSGLTLMTSVGIRAIHRLFYHLHPEGSVEFQRILDEGVRQGKYKAPHLKLFNPPQRVLEPLRMAGVDMYIEVLTGTEESALECFLIQAVVDQHPELTGVEMVSGCS